VGLSQHISDYQPNRPHANCLGEDQFQSGHDLWPSDKPMVKAGDLASEQVSLALLYPQISPLLESRKKNENQIFCTACPQCPGASNPQAQPQSNSQVPYKSRCHLPGPADPRLQMHIGKSGIVAHTPQTAQVGGSQVVSQPGLCNEALSQQTNK
jgi:hypothetical protein